MDYAKSMTNVCRTCMIEYEGKRLAFPLDAIESSNSNPLTLRQKLEAFAPELDLSADTSSVVCSECAEAIEFIHRFKRKCLETEEYIQSCFRQFSSSQSQDGVFVKREVDEPILQIVEIHSLVGDPADDLLTDNTLVEDTITAAKCRENELLSLQCNTKDIVMSEVLGAKIKVEIEQISNESPHLQLVDSDSIIFNSANIENPNENNREFSLNNVSINAVSSSAGIGIPNGNDEDSTNDIDYCSDSMIDQPIKENTHCYSEYNTDSQYNYMIFETFHILDKSQIMLFKCNNCSYSISRRVAINSHMKTHANKKAYQCDKCGFENYLKTILVAHAQKHRKDQPRQCSTCNFATAFVSQITHKRKTRNVARMYSCVQCNFFTQSASALQSHLEVHKTNKNGGSCTCV